MQGWTSRLSFLVLALGSIIVLVWAGQPVAAGLIPLIGVLLLMLERREHAARSLAHRIQAGQSDEKFEVAPGGLGDLCRAINGLVQERRMQQRLQTLAPVSLPASGVQALLDGHLNHSSEPRLVVVVLVSCGQTRQIEARARRAALLAWQTLADAAHEQAARHEALLQPCGDSILLAFGAFGPTPTATMISSAMAAADALQQAWRSGPLASGPLAISMTSGPALVMLLPGLGCCILGMPIEQAQQIERMALIAPHTQILCDESLYYAMQQAGHANWRPTELRVPAGEGGMRTVYRHHTGAL